MPGDMAARIGSMIFERALKLGLSYPWERALSEEPHFTRDNLRGSTISQTIALLSAAPAHRAVAAAYHGCLILVTLRDRPIMSPTNCCFYRLPVTRNSLLAFLR